jgi:hypothetical protein
MHPLLALIGLSVFGQVDVDNWIFVSRQQVSAEVSMLLRPQDATKQRAALEAQGALIQEDKYFYGFDEATWQEGRMTRQRSVYEALKRSGTAGESDQALAVFVQERLVGTGLAPAVGATRRLRVVRVFSLRHDGNMVDAVVSTPPPTTDQPVLVAAPRAVVPFEDPARASPWVSYPTTYAFCNSVKLMMNGGTRQSCMRRAIQLIDAHIDTFMAERAKYRAAIEVAVDGIDRRAAEGKAVKNLPAAWAAKVLAISGTVHIPGKLDPNAVKAWIREATVDRVASKIYIEVGAKDGRVIDVEVP